MPSTPVAADRRARAAGGPEGARRLPGTERRRRGGGRDVGPKRRRRRPDGCAAAARRGDRPLTRKVSNSRVGIIGLGRIGGAIAKRLSAFDCDISYHNRHQASGLPYRYVDSPIDLVGMDNVVLLPHVGSATVETRAAMENLVLRNLDEFLATGRLVTPVLQPSAS